MLIGGETLTREAIISHALRRGAGQLHAPVTRKPTERAPSDWRPWLATLFPRSVVYPFADRHEEFWEYVWEIEPYGAPRPFVGIWPRGGGKSTSAELATTSLGVRDKRRYALYVRETQESADKSVANIAGLLESSSVERYYPEHADRMVSKFGSSRGWRRNRLRTSGGFTVDAIGLDTASRGVKVDEQRPDLIILDDIDDKHDTLATTAKKISTITHSILPAGSENVAVLAIQNLIIPDGFFTRMVDGRADYLADRIVSGPYPALDGFQWEQVEDAETGTTLAVITHGEPTWEGQSLEWCQREINKDGLSAFRKECQHEVTDRSDSLALRFHDHHKADITDEQCRALVKMGRVFGGIDFGAWRFAFTLWASDRSGAPHLIGEIFSQRESLGQRAEKIWDLCQRYGITGRIPIWGDAANPQDIIEINIAFRRIGSPLRVVKVESENKLRKASVERINDLLDREAIRFRRAVGDGMHWLLGMNAASGGTPMQGSRLFYEIEHWGYPVPKEGEAQEQDPEDDTADGADAVASMRYALMSHLRAASAEVKTLEPKREDRARPYDYDNKRFVRDPVFDDEVNGPGNRKFTRPITTPRPRVGR